MYILFFLEMFSHREKYFCEIRRNTDRKKNGRVEEMDSHQQYRRFPVPASGMTDFSCYYSAYSKNGLHFQVFHIRYTHEYYKILTGDVESSHFTYTFQLFFTKLDPI